MFYKLLGMVVWNGAKLVLGRRFGSSHVPKPLLVAGGLAVAGGVAALLRRNSSSDD